VAVISGILSALGVATLIAAVDSEVVAAIFVTIINILSSLITLPLMAAVATVLYFDLRVRKEGFDLQLLARGVGEDASAYATSPQAVGEASGLGGGGFAPPQQAGGFAPPAPPEQSGGFAPPQPPGGSAPPPATPNGGLQSGDPLADPPPPERREGDGGAGS